MSENIFLSENIFNPIAPKVRKQSEYSNCHQQNHNKRNCPNLVRITTTATTSSERIENINTVDDDEESEDEVSENGDEENGEASFDVEVDYDEESDDEVNDDNANNPELGEWQNIVLQLRDQANQNNNEDLDPNGVPVFKLTSDECGPDMTYLRDHGVQRGSSLLRYFMIFITPAIINTFTMSTNVFGRLYYRNEWTDLTNGELVAIIYLLTNKFYFYRGASEQRPDNVSATMYPVTKLVDPKYNHLNYIANLDNWYTSLPLVKWLIERGIHLVGTIKINKQGLPANGKYSKGHRQPRGAYKQSVQNLVGSDWKIYFTAWIDSKPVHLLSTFQGFLSTCFRRVSEATGWVRKELPIPSIIHIYNKGMGGTDGMDQWLEMFRPKSIKTTTWLPKVFIHVINIAVVNSFIIHKIVEQKDKRYTLTEYVRDLMVELANYYYDELSQNLLLAQSSRNETQAVKGKRLKTLQKDHFRLLGALHQPTKLSLIEGSVREEKNRKRNHYENNCYKRSKCILCHSSTSTYCNTCDVYLHINENGKECWKIFHTQKNLLVDN